MIPQSFEIPRVTGGKRRVSRGRGVEGVAKQDQESMKWEGERWNTGEPVSDAWPRMDGTTVEGGVPPGGRYGQDWQEAVFTAEDVLQNDPGYEFLVQVAGATNGRVEDLMNMDVLNQAVSKANRAAWSATRLVEKLQERWEVFDEFDSVMVDFDTDASGAEFVEGVAFRETLRLITARLTRDMIETRKSYTKTLSKISSYGKIEAGQSAGDVEAFHRRVAVMVDATHWFLEPIHRKSARSVYGQSGVGVKASGLEEGVEDDFELMHEQVVADMASDHFAVVAHKQLQREDPELLPAFLRLVHGAAADRRHLNHYRSLGRATGAADIDEGGRKSVAIDSYLFLMAVLDISWQVAVVLQNHRGVLRTEPETPWQILLGAPIAEGGGASEEDVWGDEVEMTPKQLWYRWLTDILKRILSAGKEQSALSEMIAKQVIAVPDGEVVEYPFQKLHDLANQYNQNTGIKRDVKFRWDQRLWGIKAALARMNLERIKGGFAEFKRWLDEYDRRKQVLHPLVVETKKLVDFFPDPRPRTFGYEMGPSRSGVGSSGRGESSGTPSADEEFERIVYGRTTKPHQEEEEEEEEEEVKDEEEEVKDEELEVLAKEFFKRIPPEDFSGAKIIGASMRRRGRRQSVPHFISDSGVGIDGVVRALARFVDAFRRLRDTHQSMRDGMEGLLRDVLRDPRGRRGGRGGVDPEWALNPRFTGRITMSPPLMSGIYSAINEIRQFLPRLAPRSIRDPMEIHRAFSVTPFLSQIYASLVALHIHQAATLYPRQVVLDKTYERGRLARRDLLVRLSSWIWGTPPHDTGVRNAAARGRDSGTAGRARLGGVTVETLPPPIHPTDSRYMKDTSYGPSAVQLSRRRSDMSSSSSSIPPLEDVSDETERRQKRRRVREAPIGRPIQISARFDRGQGERESERFVAKDVARHIVHHWDGEYIRGKILENMRASML